MIFAAIATIVVATSAILLLLWTRPAGVPGRTALVRLFVAIAVYAAGGVAEVVTAADVVVQVVTPLALLAVAGTALDLTWSLLRPGRPWRAWHVVGTAGGAVGGVAVLATLQALGPAGRPPAQVLWALAGAAGAATAALVAAAAALWSRVHRDPPGAQTRRMLVLVTGLTGCAAGVVATQLAGLADASGVHAAGSIQLTLGVIAALAAATPPRPARQWLEVSPEVDQLDAQLIRFARAPTEIAQRALENVCSVLRGEAGLVRDVDGSALATVGCSPAAAHQMLSEPAGARTTRLTIAVPRVDGDARLVVDSTALVPLLGDIEVRTVEAFAERLGVALDRVAVTTRLAERERALSDAQRMAHVGDFTWDVDADTVTWSDELYRVFAVDPATFEPSMERYRALVHPDDVAEQDAIIRRALEDGPGWTSTYRIVRPDGQVRILETRARVHRDDQGRASRIAGACRDVTEEHQRVQRLEHQREQLQRLGRELVRSEERERRRLGLQLHDEIGQLVTSLQLELAAHGARCATGELEQLHSQLRDLHQQVRSLADGLRPAVLQDLGLAAGIRHLGDRATETLGVEVTTDLDGLGSQRFGSEVETAAYRIVQEALTNVARHAQVGEASVEVAVDHDALAVVVRDRGRGFDPAADRPHGTGLSGMQERAAAAGGLLQVDSSTGGGTTVRARLPLRAHTERSGGPTPSATGLS